MTRYTPDAESLAAHSAPDWWRDAKLGVMITWGLYSVPAYAPRGTDVVKLLAERPDDALKLTPYAEWYENSAKFDDGPTAQQHRERFGDAPYTAFRHEFEAGLTQWSAEPMISFIASIGARYVVPVTKHHDSYCLWPTSFANPLRGADWHAPRDLISEMAVAARIKNMRFGVYYSAGLDWTLNPEPIANLGEMRAALPSGDLARQMMRDHYRELIDATDPDILWNDIGYPDAGDLWRLLADYYNDREDRLINDRFQLPTPAHAAMSDPAERAAFNRDIADALRESGFAFAPDVPDVFDHRTPEYATSSTMGDTAWETVRGVGHSFGYKANETADDFLTGDELIAMFLRIVGHGGNLLINIGPRFDGSIPDEQAGPLRELGAFLRANGEAIYASRPDRELSKQEICGTDVLPVRVGRRCFALIAGSLPASIRLSGWASVSSVASLEGQVLSCRREGDDLVLDIPAAQVGSPAIVLELLS
ncbi:alpha-L-fucosidase [Erythrobacter sp.]|uniref:alpha-L-fucosidase n=1 Tax=Erythrobacter sp. TaxID=1042 RepID=UPI001B030BD1|nr:alpha-L-fucosidase [Erythrobacter sp.]MBO6525431.1 alpha-L-fucosidase [Erythrobacter sp.]MBO6529896.1 alpha-L-fucosidase [Erythrobacter sp.]